jgi:hypothetical protein
MAETIAELLKRAEAAIREARILLEISQHWQQRVRAINYPQNVKEVSPRYQAPPRGDEAGPSQTKRSQPHL